MGKQSNSKSLEPIRASIQKKGWKAAFRRVYGGVYKYYGQHVSRIPSNLLRCFLYKHIFKIRIGKRVVFHKGLEVRDGYKISIGDGTIIGDDCLLDGRGGLTIGRNVNLSSKVNIYTGQHDVRSCDFGGVFSPVNIGDRVWLSANTIILPGVAVGEGTVLAAGAVATKALEAHGIYGGIPAKRIGERREDINYSFNGKADWFL